MFLEKKLISERFTPESILVPVLVQDTNKTLSEFWNYCIVNERLTERVAKDYRSITRRFLKFSDGLISKDSLRDYLTTYLKKAPKTYNNQLDALRAFVKRFFKRSDLMQGFKKAYQPINYEPKLPTKKQIRKSFNALTNDLERSLYLLYATSGLRKNEVLELRKNPDINLKLRPNVTISVPEELKAEMDKFAEVSWSEICRRAISHYISERKNPTPDIELDIRDVRLDIYHNSGYPTLCATLRIHNKMNTNITVDRILFNVRFTSASAREQRIGSGYDLFRFKFHR